MLKLADWKNSRILAPSIPRSELLSWSPMLLRSAGVLEIHAIGIMHNPPASEARKARGPSGVS